MRSARLLIGLLLLATVLVDLVVVSVVASELPPWIERGRAGRAELMLISLPLAQASLVAVWAGFGGRSLAWRTVGLVLIITLWSAVVGWLMEPSRPMSMATPWTILLLAQTTLIFACVMLARSTGLRVTRATDIVSSQQPAGGRRRFQFSLAYSLSWITAVALVLGILQYVLYRKHIPPDPDFWPDVALLSIAHTAIALSTLWTVLGRQRLVLRLVGLLLTALAAVAAYYHLTEIAEWLAAVTLCLAQLLWLVGSLWVIRVAGYRLVWPSSRRRKSGGPERLQSA
jgi:hypothetical protein